MRKGEYEDLFSGYSILDCVIKTHTEIYFLLQKDGQSHGGKAQTRLLGFIDKRWSLIDKNNGVALVSIDFEFGSERLVVVDELGGVFSYINGEKIKERNIPGSDECYVEKIKTLDKQHTFAVGSERHIWRRNGENDWTQIGKSTRTADIEDKDGLDMGFQCIHGFNEKDIYVSGYAADTWRYDGENWCEIDLPITTTINSILCADDGWIYLAGKMGTLLVGSNDQWDKVDSDVLGDSRLDCLTNFGDEVFFSSPKSLFKINSNRQVKPVLEVFPIEPFSAGVIESNEHVLIACGGRKVRMYDGVDWHILADF